MDELADLLSVGSDEIPERRHVNGKRIVGEIVAFHFRQAPCDCPGANTWTRNAFGTTIPPAYSRVLYQWPAKGETRPSMVPVTSR
jgi:hypothetical protein